MGGKYLRWKDQKVSALIFLVNLQLLKNKIIGESEMSCQTVK